ncbi:MAG: hypothetical protein AAFQ64_02200, partial [Pseudomonadota bacterium]
CCSIGENGLTVLKNSVFDEIGEIFVRTAQPTFRGGWLGQISLLLLRWQLIAPHGRFHLTLRFQGFFPKNCDI